MSAYYIFVFVHVVAAIVLVGATLFAPLIGAAIRRSTTVSSVRELARYSKLTGQVAGGAAVVILASGLYLSFAGDWWGSGWLEISLLMFVLAGFLALGIIDKAASRLIEAADEVPDGPVTPALDSARRDPRGTVAESLLVGTDVTIVFLMTNKPGFLGAIITAAVGLSLGALLAIRERRHDRAALAAAVAEAA